MPVVITSESPETAESRSMFAVAIAMLVVVAAVLLGYFLWYAPSQTSPTVIDRQTVIHDPAPAANPPIIIQGQKGDKGDTGDKGDPGSTNNTQGTQGTQGTQSTSGDGGN